ncbi:TniQ family protein [Bacillus cereus group sp. N18]|uniref:TniQ family protein n=1 Tax=Bacillus cereus group sp. N18 TaxID=2794590 RepID=UPI0008733C66|nr:TniQ family protein [Bacillus cereus group sp. N18]MBJ8046538.1 TniQ family protein [Bacillus cereus group sp. N18]OFD04477.1 hypothetical protein BTGOE7_44800 [Bacillus thuringiensis]
MKIEYSHKNLLSIKANSFSKRSLLYSIEPLGKGTPFVESLTSYICRLAYNHNIFVSVLINEMIAPNLSSHSYLKGGNLISGSSLLSNGRTAINIIDTLEKLTMRGDLSALTLLNWSSILKTRFINPKKKWCPKCFNEQQEYYQDLYEPYIWQVKSIFHCPKHKILLEDLCPKCKRSIAHISNRMINGQCPFCYVSLGDVKLYNISNRPLFISSDNQRNINTYSYLLQNNFEGVFPTRHAVKNFFNVLSDSYNSISINKFSKELSFDRTQVMRWFDGSYRPPLDFWSKICGILGIPLKSILMEEQSRFKKLESMLEQKKATGIRKSIIADKEVYQQIENYLINYLKNGKLNFSFTALCKKINQDPSKIRRAFPKLSKLIISKYREQKDKEKEKFIKETELKVRKILNDKTKVPLSLNGVLEMFNVSYRVAKKYFPELCDEIVEYYKEFKSKKRKELIKENKEEIKKIILFLHQQGIYPSDSAIRKFHTKPTLFKNAYYREYRELIRKHLGY